MFSWIYHNIIYQPLYNGLIFLMDVIPWADAGIAIIIFTVIVKLILFPLSKKAVTTQLKMKKVEPELAEIRKKYKEDKTEQARKTMELYRANKINPFMSILLILIQLPIIFGLYRIFLVGLPQVDGSLLYSFVKIPEMININFLGLIDISGKSFILALLAGISTYIQIKLSVPMQNKPQDPSKELTREEKFRADFAKSMNTQMKFMLPALAFVVSWTISGAIALYWITSNLFTIGQELVIRRTVK